METTTYYLSYDQVGTLRVVTDAAGNVVTRIDYDSFGNIVGDTNPTFLIPFGFAGGLHDRDTGLVRFGFRDHDPEVGRWTAKDPIGFGGGDADLYGYCLGDPVGLTDPTGEMSIPAAVLGVLAAWKVADWAASIYYDLQVVDLLKEQEAFYRESLAGTNPCKEPERYEILKQAIDQVVLQQTAITARAGLNWMYGATRGGTWRPRGGM